MSHHLTVVKNWTSSHRGSVSILLIAGILAACLPLTAGRAQDPDDGRPVLYAGRTDNSIRLDGLLSEAAWASADSVQLVQVEPVEGEAASFPTTIRVLAGEDALYIGIIAWDPEPEGIVSYTRARDASLRSEDHVMLLLDTFQDGRRGYLFAVNAGGARYDALVSEQGERQNSQWDAIWDAAVARGPWGWSVEIWIPVSSLMFREGLDGWWFNVERRIQRKLETDRWASPRLDYRIGQSNRAGLLAGLPEFSLGLGLSVRPSFVAGRERTGPGSTPFWTNDLSLDVSQRLSPNLLGQLTINTDFAETEVDTRRSNLTRFPLLFPEKRTFFLEGADLFDFGLGLGRDLLPFHSRRIGLVSGSPVPVTAGGRISGQLNGTSVGALAVRTGEVAGLTPTADMGVVRIRQNLLAESSIGMITTFGDPQGRSGSWLSGVDLTYQTSSFRGDKNFIAGLWGMLTDREDLSGDRSAVGLKIDYPNDLWDIAFTWKRIGESFDPSLGFVPRPATHQYYLSAQYSPRPDWKLVRQMFHEHRLTVVTDLAGQWESWRFFWAPLNWRLESGDRVEFNIVPTGERLPEPFEISSGVVLPAGSHDWWRYRLEAQFAEKRRVSGQATWWFGGFYGGHLDQIELTGAWKPSTLLVIELKGEHNIARLPQGDFEQTLAGVRIRLNISSDLQISSYLQYDDESRQLGTNTRLRWTYHPYGEIFLVWNNNVADPFDRWETQGYQLMAKVKYAWWF